MSADEGASGLPVGLDSKEYLTSPPCLSQPPTATTFPMRTLSKLILLAAATAAEGKGVAAAASASEFAREV